MSQRFRSSSFIGFSAVLSLFVASATAQELQVFSFGNSGQQPPVTIFHSVAIHR